MQYVLIVRRSAIIVYQCTIGSRQSCLRCDVTNVTLVETSLVLLQIIITLQIRILTDWAHVRRRRSNIPTTKLTYYYWYSCCYHHLSVNHLISRAIFLLPFYSLFLSHIHTQTYSMRNFRKIHKDVLAVLVLNINLARLFFACSHVP